MERRFPDGVDEEHQRQVDFEIGVVLQMGFPSYFLVVADFIMWAKNNGIRVGPGRGSAAGSLAAYALGITDLADLLGMHINTAEEWVKLAKRDRLRRPARTRQQP